MPNIKSIGWMVSKCRREGSDCPPPPPPPHLMPLCNFFRLIPSRIKTEGKGANSFVTPGGASPHKTNYSARDDRCFTIFLILFTCTAYPSRLQDLRLPFTGEEVTVHNTGISRFLSISVWVLLSPTIWSRETRPITRRPCPRTVWRKKVSPGVSQSSTVYQAGDWTWNFLVVSQRSYQLC